jgi:hypothetical protein
MKTKNAYYLRSLLFLLFLPLFFPNIFIKQINAQPQYTLTAKNYIPIFSTQFQFDIYLSRTGGGNENYVKGQFVLTYNSAILPVGGILSMSYVAGSSQLPASNQSTNCLVYTGGAQGYALYITAPLDHAGTTIPDAPAEVRIGTYRVSNTLPFNPQFINAAWRFATPNPYTKIWYYYGSHSVQLSNSYINYQVYLNNCWDCYHEYNALLMNDVQINPNTYEFDIYFKNTSYGYSLVAYGLQVSLLFDESISNGGILSSSYISGTSGMSISQIPDDPDISNFIGGKRVWKLVAKKTDYSLSTYLSDVGYGTRLGRFRITTSAPSFASVRPNLSWNFDSTYGYKTIIEVFNPYSPGTYNLTYPPHHLNNLSNPVLPVELVSFKASLCSDREVLLDWTTATEVNNYGFKVERKVLSQQSAVGNNDFEPIGFVAGSGNSNSTKSYDFVDNKLNGGSKFAYRLKQIDNNGAFTYSSIQEVELLLNEYVLSQNYPNPFNPTTTIEYIIPQAGQVSLSVYDVLGERVSDLVNEFKESGIYTVDFDASNLSSGSYIYVLRSNGNTVSKKLTVIK